MIVLMLLARVGLLSAALWLIGRMAARQRVAVRRHAAEWSLVAVLGIVPLSLWLQGGLVNLQSGWIEPHRAAALGAAPMDWSMALAWTLAGIYLAGVAAGLARFMVGLTRLLRLRCHAAPRSAQGLLRRLHPAAATRPRLEVSRECTLPFSTRLGPFGRGRIVLPAGLIGGCDRDTLAAILRHELEHLQAQDPWWSILSRLACAMFWPVPFVHGLSRQLDAVQEAAADQAAVAGQPLPVKALYAECLIALAARPGITRPIALVCRAVGRSLAQMELRIRSILTGADGVEASGRRVAVRRRLCNGITGLVVLSLPLIFVIGVTPDSGARAAAAKAGQPAPALADEEAALRASLSPAGPQTGGSLLNDELRLRAGL